MTIHLVKLCVGAQSVGDLEAWIEKKAAANKKAHGRRIHAHVTRMRPRRQEELLSGGSLYWVIKGVVQARQEIMGFERRIGADGIERTAILLKPQLVLTQAQPRRAFQGWRYLEPGDAPADLGAAERATALPPKLQSELAELGLL